jgi:hypothetical protein
MKKTKPPEEPVWHEPLFTASCGYRQVFGRRPARVRYLRGPNGQIVEVQFSDGKDQRYTAWVRGRMT